MIGEMGNMDIFSKRKRALPCEHCGREPARAIQIPGGNGKRHWCKDCRLQFLLGYLGTQLKMFLGVPTPPKF